MGVQTHEASMITTHAGHINAEADAVGEIAGQLAHDGIGPNEMYGLLVGTLVHPILQAVVNSKATAITNLSEVLASTQSTLSSAADVYRDGELDATQQSEAIETEIDQIEVPR